MNLRRHIGWNGLTAIAAVAALILSQFPPVAQMIKGTDIRITAPDSIQVWHYLGNVTVTLFLDVHNVRGDSVNIAKIDSVILERDSGQITELPIRTYLNQNGATLHIGTISLNPDQRWTNYVYCNRPFPRAELERANELNQNILVNVIENQEKQEKLPPEKRVSWVPIEESLYQQSLKFFNDKITFKNEGNYRLFLRLVF